MHYISKSVFSGVVGGGGGDGERERGQKSACYVIKICLLYVDWAPVVQSRSSGDRIGVRGCLFIVSFRNSL